jgi:phage shock protein PspC (stress-responsive transcriptional regulator)
VVEKIKSFFEIYAFGVCEYIGQKFDISNRKVRLLFIYVSFITVGSTLLVYFTLAAMLQVKNLLKKRRSIIDY